MIKKAVLAAAAATTGIVAFPSAAQAQYGYYDYGRYERPATPADIAPTLARVAGAKMPKAEGRVLAEALR